VELALGPFGRRRLTVYKSWLKNGIAWLWKALALIRGTLSPRKSR
jgi:hypothetical protein